MKEENRKEHNNIIIMDVDSDNIALEVLHDRAIGAGDIIEAKIHNSINELNTIESEFPSLIKYQAPYLHEYTPHISKNQLRKPHRHAYRLVKEEVDGISTLVEKCSCGRKIND